MTPARHNLTVYRYRDFCKDFTFLDGEKNLIPIDTWSFKSQIRDTNCIDGTLLAEFTIDRDNENSTITLSLSDTQTALIPEDDAYWDLLVHINECDESLICGKVKILCCVTEI